MTLARLRGRIARAEAAALVATDLPARLPPADDSQDLAVEVAADFGRSVQMYREVFKLSPDEARARAAECSAFLVERALTKPPEEVAWCDLDTLARQDPELARRRWLEVQEAARAELRNGHRAARTLKTSESTCWPRARFLALRAELAEAWQSRDQLEQHLIDQMVLFQTQMEHWQEALNAYLQLAALGHRGAGKHGPFGEPPRVSEAEAADRAAGMVERMHRLFLRTLRALVDLRRRCTPVVVRRAGQVNIAQQQLNMAR
jgi:hypothetical protein